MSLAAVEMGTTLFVNLYFEIRSANRTDLGGSASNLCRLACRVCILHRLTLSDFYLSDVRNGVSEEMKC